MLNMGLFGEQHDSLGFYLFFFGRDRQTGPSWLEMDEAECKRILKENLIEAVKGLKLEVWLIIQPAQENHF